MKTEFFFVKLRRQCITTVEIHSSSNDWILFLIETKDKAALFKGYMAGLFSSQDGTSLHITDWRNAAWWNVPVKLGECDALKKEAMNIFWKCWQFSQPEYKGWLWKISFQRWQQCNKSQRESHCWGALPVGMWSCLDDRSALEEAVE